MMRPAAQVLPHCFVQRRSMTAELTGLPHRGTASNKSACGPRPCLRHLISALIERRYRPRCRCRAASYSTTAAATETFSDSTGP
jgi:hypothetical protein